MRNFNLKFLNCDSVKEIIRLINEFRLFLVNHNYGGIKKNENLMTVSVSKELLILT